MVLHSPAADAPRVRASATRQYQGAISMSRRGGRLTALGVGLCAVMAVGSGGLRVNAQETNRGDDAAISLAGRKVRIDKKSGKLRELSQQEARELVATL